MKLSVLRPRLGANSGDSPDSKDVVTRPGGFKMWWKRKTDSAQDDNELYPCHKCYSTDSEAMPEDYEDVEESTITTLRARRIEINGPDSIPQRKRKN